MAAEGLAHQPACGWPTDGHTVGPGPRVDVICILNHSEWESLLLCSRVSLTREEQRVHFARIMSDVQIKLGCIQIVAKGNFPQGALWFSNPVVTALPVKHALLKHITRRKTDVFLPFDTVFLVLHRMLRCSFVNLGHVMSK